MSSSGFVPLPLSNRDKNEKGPSNAPLPSFIVPLPCFSVPSHTADPVRVAIILSPLDVVVYDFARERASCKERRSPVRRSGDLEIAPPRCVTQAASGAAVVGRLCSRFASASARCLRPSQMLRAHQIAPIGTATQEIPDSPKPSHRING